MEYRITYWVLAASLIALAACAAPLADGHFRLRGYEYSLNPGLPGIVDVPGGQFDFTTGTIVGFGGYAGATREEWESMTVRDQAQMAWVAESALSVIDRMEQRKPLSEIVRLHQRILRGFLAVYRRSKQQ